MLPLGNLCGSNQHTLLCEHGLCGRLHCSTSIPPPHDIVDAKVQLLLLMIPNGMCGCEACCRRALRGHWKPKAAWPSQRCHVRTHVTKFAERPVTDTGPKPLLVIRHIFCVRTELDQPHFSALQTLADVWTVGTGRQEWFGITSVQFPHGLNSSETSIFSSIMQVARCGGTLHLPMRVVSSPHDMGWNAIRLPPLSARTVVHRKTTHL